jgi:hypothetical protein
MDVVHEEAAGCPEEDREVAHFEKRTRTARPWQQIDEKCGADHHRDPAAQAVHVVDQVERVGQPDDPDERHEPVQHHGVDPVEPVVEGQQHRGECDLRDQLR